MTSTNTRKLTQLHLRSFVYRKYLEIIMIISSIVFVCLLLNNQFLNSFKSLDLLTLNFNELQQPQTIDFAVFDDRPTYSPFALQLKNILKCIDRPLEGETFQHGDFWMLKNYIRGRKSINMGCGESITYTTNGDYTFMDNIATVVKRWMAPVSFAIYSPGFDYNSTMDSILYVLNCLPESSLIRDYVTFHIFLHKDHLPTYIAKDEKEALEWPFNCQVEKPPYENVNRSDMYKTKQNLTYPINVGRNLARKTANTYFVFPCDIELYPTPGLVKQFLDMVVRNSSAVLEGDKPKVFPLPVFELEKNASLPETKTELVNMLNSKMAVPFHVHVCPNCHLVPKQKEWLKANDSDELEVFTVGKRYNEFCSWEPFYISDNKEPIFDERVTWEGQSNKRIQNYAMCLMDYEYHILHPAYLVHTPGIKKLNFRSKAHKSRLRYAKAMAKVIEHIIKPEYAILFGKDKRCKV